MTFFVWDLFIPASTCTTRLLYSRQTEECRSALPVVDDKVWPLTCTRVVNLLAVLLWNGYSSSCFAKLLQKVEISFFSFFPQETIKYPENYGDICFYSALHFFASCLTYFSNFAAPSWKLNIRVLTAVPRVEPTRIFTSFWTVPLDLFWADADTRYLWSLLVWIDKINCIRLI